MAGKLERLKLVAEIIKFGAEAADIVHRILASRKSQAERIKELEEELERLRGHHAE